VHVYNCPKLLIKNNQIQNVRVALGNFDGIHRGHRSLIKGLVARAKQDGSSSVVVTFNPHPAQFFCKSVGFRKIDNLLIQQTILTDLGVDALLELPFDAALSAMSPEDFIENILGSLPLTEITVGRDFRFGHGRAGDSKLLIKIGTKQGFTVNLVDPVTVDGHLVSSSHIRHLLAETGDVVAARKFLMRPFLMHGVVVQGDQLGRKLGIPTANLSDISQVIPKSGVYSGRMRVHASIAAVLRPNDWFGCVINIGSRPTVNSVNSEIRVEVHAYDVAESLNLYGETLEVEFYKRLREEQKFASVEQLVTQIRRDIDLARADFNS